MNKVRSVKVRHLQLQVIEFCRNNEITLAQLRRTAELMQHQDMNTADNLMNNQSPAISAMEFRGDFI